MNKVMTCIRSRNSDIPTFRIFALKSFFFNNRCRITHSKLMAFPVLGDLLSTLRVLALKNVFFNNRCRITHSKLMAFPVSGGSVVYTPGFFFKKSFSITGVFKNIEPVFLNG